MLRINYNIKRLNFHLFYLFVYDKCYNLINVQHVVVCYLIDKWIYIYVCNKINRNNKNK